jgi:hypothetical protein
MEFRLSSLLVKVFRPVLHERYIDVLYLSATSLRDVDTLSIYGVNRLSRFNIDEVNVVQNRY